jgi:formylmethanofuran dehydrogenase subunit E
MPGTNLCAQEIQRVVEFHGHWCPGLAIGIRSYRAEWTERIMGADPALLFHVQPVSDPPPQRARLMASSACEACGERTMESRTRRFDGRVLCLPCFERLDRRL